MSKVVITNYSFESLAPEKEVLEPLGCRIVARQYESEEDLIALVADADYVIIQPPARLTASVIGTMKKCKLIVRNGVGTDNIDLDAAAARDIPVCNVPDYCTDEVADHTLALLLALTRRVVQISNHVRQGVWELPVPRQEIRVLKALRVGIVGFGRIGRQVIERLKSFRCTILVFDPLVDDAVIQDAGCIPTSIDDLLSTSDVISLHCPSNDQTRYMINKDSIERMKKGVMLINVARGDLVNTDDLITALGSGQIGAVALDITDPEPINKDNPLLEMDNVIITNHIAWLSVGAMEQVRKRTVDIVGQAIRGEKLPNVVNDVAT